MNYQLVATMAAGLESVTTKELKALGIKPAPKMAKSILRVMTKRLR